MPRASLVVISAATVCIILAQQIVHVNPETRFHRALLNSAHTPWFFLVTLLLWRAIDFVQVLTMAQRIVISLCSSLFLAVGLEALQVFNARDASGGDVIRNLAGASSAACVLLAAHYWRSSGRALSGLLISIALLLFFAPFWSPARLFLLIQAQRAIKPYVLRIDDPRYSVLGSLSGDWELIQSPPSWEGVGEQQWIRVSLETSRRWPGLSVVEPVPDWSAYDQLEITAYLQAAEPLTLDIRLQTKADRGIDSIFAAQLQPGRNRIAIPLEELASGDKAKLTDIRRLYIYANTDTAVKHFHLNSIELLQH